jgi:hypothetical protein
MSYGLEIYDENGELIVDNEKLMNRVFYQTIVTSETTHYYSEPLDYKPPVMQVSYRTPEDEAAPPSYSVNHITNSSGQYTGIDVVDETLGGTANKTIIAVFKIR